jgi:hypothetical protein
MNNKDDNVFWVEKPIILIQTFDKFIPNRKMSLFQQMNSITLFCIYALIFLHIFGLTNRITSTIFIGIIVLLIIVYVNKYRNPDEENSAEKFFVESGYYDSDDALRVAGFYSENNRNRELDEMVRQKSLENQKILNVPREPTIDNPFMNPILNDFNTENMPVPSNADDELIQDTINLTYNKDLFKDVSDLYDAKNVERQFYTVPGGAVPNDQNKFAQWCYNTPYTCKEDTRNCYVTPDDIRYRNNYK